MNTEYLMDDEYFGLILAALLHDIGKYGYRVRKFTDSSGKRMTHEEIGLSILNKLPNDGPIKSFRVINRYFTRDSSEQDKRIIKLADGISASERENESEIPADIMTKPLVNVFSLINLHNKTQGNKKYWKYRKFTLKLPSEGDIISKAETEFKYLDEFIQNLSSLEKKYSLNEREFNSAERKRYLKELLDLLQRYLYYLPSSAYKTESDIDLYTHSRMTAAIASILYRISKEQGNDILDRCYALAKTIYYDYILKEKHKDCSLFNFIKEEDLEISDRIFLIIKGDFSGIQEFITSIHSSKGAIKQLKARSFYLSFLNRLIPLKIIDSLNLPETNIIYSSGGNFEIIAPNTEEDKATVKGIIDEINDFLWDKFGIKLFLSVKFIEISPICFHREFYKFVFVEYLYNKEVHNKREKLKEMGALAVDTPISKRRRFYRKIKECIERHGSVLSDGFSEVSPKNVCRICHYRIVDSDNEQICQTCSGLYELVNTLKNIASDKNKRIASEFNKGRHSELFSLQGDNLLDYVPDARINIPEPPFITIGLGIPLDKNKKNILELDEIIGKGKEDENTHRRMAALKLDVDNLGKIFSVGLGNKNLCLSLYSRLSSDIALFFEGIINTLYEKPKYRDKLYIIYSGGDDTFVIGKWDSVLDFATEMYNLFRIYTAQNADIHFSASYGLYRVTYPVYNIFSLQEHYLEKAKSIDDEKNKINISGIALSWDYTRDYNEYYLCDSSRLDQLRKTLTQETDIIEYYLFINLINTFYYLVKEEKLSPTSLEKYSIMAFNYINRLDNEKKRFDIPEIWRFRYSIIRQVNETNREDLELLWDIIKYYYTQIIVDKIAINGKILPYSLKYALILNQERNTNRG